jgi:hypothetical protein
MPLLARGLLAWVRLGKGALDKRNIAHNHSEAPWARVALVPRGHGARAKARLRP